MRPVPERSNAEIAPMKRPERPVCIVVLGMHRSGTSVLAGTLGILGASLPKNIMPPDASNPKGYFEPSDIVALHDEMLAALGSSWFDFRRLDPSIFESMPAAAFKERLVKALKNEYADSTTFVVKDPRICRFVPFWRSVVDAFCAELRVVTVIRNPLEVARSLAHRDGYSYGYNLHLWLRHVLDAEFETRDCKRMFVTYDDIMRDWTKAIGEIKNELGITISNQTSGLQAAAQAFINDNLRHHAVDEEAFAVEYRDNPLILPAYRALKKLVARSSDPKAIRDLDNIRKSFDKRTKAFDTGIGTELISAQGKLYSAQLHVAHLQGLAGKVNSLEEELAAKDERNKIDLAELEAIRYKRQVDQNRIFRLGSMLETHLANEFHRKNELCQLEERVAELTNELSNFKDRRRGRLGSRLQSLNTKLRYFRTN
jgi:hypothetical protein